MQLECSHSNLPFFASRGWNFQFRDYFWLVVRCIVHACARHSYTMSSPHIIGSKWQRWSGWHSELLGSMYCFVKFSYWCSDATMVTWCQNSTIWCHNSSSMATINTGSILFKVLRITVDLSINRLAQSGQLKDAPYCISAMMCICECLSCFQITTCTSTSCRWCPPRSTHDRLMWILSSMLLQKR